MVIVFQQMRFWSKASLPKSLNIHDMIHAAYHRGPSLRVPWLLVLWRRDCCWFFFRLNRQRDKERTKCHWTLIFNPAMLIEFRCYWSFKSIDLSNLHNNLLRRWISLKTWRVDSALCGAELVLLSSCNTFNNGGNNAVAWHWHLNKPIIFAVVSCNYKAHLTISVHQSDCGVANWCHAPGGSPCGRHGNTSVASWSNAGRN